MRNLGFMVLLCSALTCSAAEKSYQTGKLVNVDTESYSKIIPLGNGNIVSKRRHEDLLSVQVGDVVYVGSCDEKSHDCRPAHWIVGDPIQVRFDKDKMYLQSADGKELKTTVVRRTRATP